MSKTSCKAVARIPDFYQCLIISITYESADGNLFTFLSESGIKNFTNNQSEAINKQFGMKFLTSPNLFENVLIRTKEFKKEYLMKKSDLMGANRMRARPKKQIQRAERRETLMREFHNLSENEKIYQLVDFLDAISSV